MPEQVRGEKAGWLRELGGSDQVPSTVPKELLCFACATSDHSEHPSSLLMLLCIFQLNFLHEKERGTLNPLALVIMQMLRGVDCPSLHIINVSGYEWSVCYFPPHPFCAGMGRGRGAGQGDVCVMLLYLICITRRPDWVCMRVGAGGPSPVCTLLSWQQISGERCRM